MFYTWHIPNVQEQQRKRKRERGRGRVLPGLVVLVVSCLTKMQCIMQSNFNLI